MKGLYGMAEAMPFQSPAQDNLFRSLFKCSNLQYIIRDGGCELLRNARMEVS